MAYNTNKTSGFDFDTTVTINGITYDLLNLDSPISFKNEAGYWNIEVSRSESTGANQVENVDVPEADDSLSPAALVVEDTSLADVSETTTDVAETVATSDEIAELSEPTVASDADSLASTFASTFDETVSDPATVATGSDAEAATTTETTVTEEPATDDAASLVVDETISEVTPVTEGVDAELEGDDAEADLTASGDGANDLGRQLTSWLADLETFAFDAKADTTEPDGDALFPQYADAIAGVLGELQTCLETHEASADPVAAEAVSDYLAGLQAKIVSASDLLI